MFLTVVKLLLLFADTKGCVKLRSVELCCAVVVRRVAYLAHKLLKSEELFRLKFTCTGDFVQASDEEVNEP